jgi:hypothetical protein
MSTPALATRPMLASELFANACGASCLGRFDCHWCSAPCGDLWQHDDPPPAIGKRRAANHAMRLDSPYVCMGCWSYRRKHVTVSFLGGGYKDRQCCMDWSWLATDKGVWGLRTGQDEWPKDAEALLGIVRHPPERWCLALRLGDAPPQPLMQAAIVNQCDLDGIQHDSAFKFTANNLEHCFTLHELEGCLKDPEAAGDGGARLLAGLLRIKPDPVEAAIKSLREEKKPAKLERGRPNGSKTSPDNVATKLVGRSGS